MFETRNTALGGSKTADNLADADALGIDPSVIGHVLHGNYGGAVRSLISPGSNAMTGNTPRVRAAVAELLLRNGLLVLQARKAEVEEYGPLVVSCDAASKGADSTAFAWRRGHAVIKTERRRAALAPTLAMRSRCCLRSRAVTRLISDSIARLSIPTQELKMIRQVTIQLRPPSRSAR
jgi:hypothetical protein